ncbi:MAG: hypothetical protein OXU50_04305 [Gammaproteobacteria bacterium]|nr:hypothetical protein [Gammaproteobacteria bacterium]
MRLHRNSWLIVDLCTPTMQAISVWLFPAFIRAKSGIVAFVQVVCNIAWCFSSFSDEKQACYRNLPFMPTGGVALAG